jgi:hypothetical protein
VAVGYVRRLLNSAAVVKYLSRKYPDLLAELGRIVESVDLSDATPAEYPQGNGEHASYCAACPLFDVCLL